MKEVDFNKYIINEDGSIYSKRYNKDISKTTRTKYGYYIVKLSCVDGSYITKNVHRIIAEKFIPNTDMLRTVNHIDGDKSNNNISNLEWMTTQDNCIHYTSSTDRWVQGAFKRLHNDAEIHKLERRNGRSMLTYSCRVCGSEQISRLDSSIIPRGLCTSCAKKKMEDSSARY